MIVYGLRTCDTCRKALRALSAHAPVFHDVRENPLSGDQIERFLAQFGEALINRSSTTWRGLSTPARDAAAADLLAAYPTLMKRPVIDDDGTLHLGWTAKTQAALAG